MTRAVGLLRFKRRVPVAADAERHRLACVERNQACHRGRREAIARDVFIARIALRRFGVLVAHVIDPRGPEIAAGARVGVLLATAGSWVLKVDDVEYGEWLRHHLLGRIQAEVPAFLGSQVVGDVASLPIGYSEAKQSAPRRNRRMPG